MKYLQPIKAKDELPPKTIGGLSDYVWTDRGAMIYDYEFKAWSKPPSVNGSMADGFVSPDIWYKEVELSEILEDFYLWAKQKHGNIMSEVRTPFMVDEYLKSHSLS